MKRCSIILFLWTLSLSVFATEFGSDLKDEVQKANSGQRSTAIIVFADKFTTKHGKEIDWIAGYQPWGVERKITIRVDGEKYRQMAFTDFKCALPYICIIRNFPTQSSYKISGDFDNVATRARIFSTGQTCRYGSTCLLENNGTVQAKMWIRPERTDKCITPSEGEDYYDILVLVAALTMANSDLVPNWTPEELEPIKRRMNDREISKALNSDFSLIVSGLVKSADMAISKRIGGITNNASKFAGEGIKKIIDNKGTKKLMKQVPKDVMEQLESMGIKLLDIDRAGSHQVGAVLGKHNC